jgi:hypothetical protein
MLCRWPRHPGSSLHAHLPSLSAAAIKGPLTSHLEASTGGTRVHAPYAQAQRVASSLPRTSWVIEARSLLEARPCPYNVTLAVT